MYGKIKNEIPRENRRFSGTQSSEFLRNSRGRDTKYDIRKKSLLKATAIVTIAVFLFNTVFIDLVWALPKVKPNSFLRAIPAEKAWVAKAIGEKLGKEPDKRNIASGNWTEEYHDELNAQIRKLIGKKRTDVTGQYPVEKQKKELNTLLKDFFATLSKEEKAKWNGIISNSNLEVNDTEELFKKLAGLLDSKNTGFFYLKPPKGVFYLKRQGLPPLIAEEHFGHSRKSKADKKEINNVYIAEPSVKLKTNEEQQGIILHGLVHLLIGAGEAEHNFASKVQMRFERYLLEKEIPADFLKRYSRYYELKSEILEAEKANDNRLYQKKRAELIKTVDYLRKLTETVPDEQFKRAFELLKLNQIENQEDVNLMLGSFDEFYHLSTPEYNTQEKAVLEEIAREMAQGLKKWHNPDEVYQEAMSGMKTFHIKNFLPESIDEKNELKRRFLSGQIRSGIQKFNRANHIGACFARGLDAVSVLTKGLTNKDSSVPFLKAAVKHELIHYFSFKGIIPIRYEREDISTAITVIEFLEQEGMEIFNKYQNAFTPVGVELYLAGVKLQKEGKVFLDEDYLLKRAFEIFEADERLSDNAIMLVRDPVGRDEAETALLTAQVNDMRQRVIGVIMAGALIQHSKESGEPLLETLIEFFKVLSEKMAIPRVAEIETAITQAKEMGVPEKDRQELNELLRKAQKRKDEVEKVKGYILTWARSKTAIPELSYVEAGGKIPQWVFLPAPHKKIVGVEEDLYRLSPRVAYGLVVPPVFEAKYGAKVREKLIEDEFKDNAYFDLLWRIMDTPRIMAFGWHNYPGTIDWVKAVYEERFKEDNLLIAQTLLSAWARPLQYLDSFIYRWFKGIDEDRRLKNKDVRQAVENTRDAYRRVMETIAPEELYHLVKDEIWPEFKKLIDVEMAEQKEMELFKQEHQGVSPNQIQQMWDGMSDTERKAVQREMEKEWQAMSSEEKQKIIEEVERQIQEAIEEYLAQSSRAQAGGERSSQSPAMPGQADALKTSGFSRKPAEGKSEDMNRLAGQLQRMAERLKEKAENLSRQSNQTGGGAKGLSEEAEDIEGNAGAADLSKDVEELAETAQETVEGFSFLKKQTEQFKNRANALNEAASRSSDLDSADKMKQNSEKLNRTAEEMDKTAGKGKEISQEAVGDAKQIKDIISKSGRREVNAIRQKAENISQKADELAEYARDLARQAGKAENQAGEVGQSASEMGMETAQRAEDEKQKTVDGRREKGEGRPQTIRSAQVRGKQKTEAGESSWEMDDQKSEDGKQKTKQEALKGMDSLAQQAREKNIAEGGEFDLSKYLEEEKSSASTPKEEISKRTKEQIREHEARMKKKREENFLKKEGITTGQYQSYQRAKISVQFQIANIERELKSILIPGGGSEFLRERSYGEIDDDSLAEIPAGKTKIFKQQQKPQKKKAIISLLVDISGSMEGEKLENAVLTALAFQEALKKFEISSNVDLQFEVVGYSKNPYFYLKDYKDKLTIKKAFSVINGLMSEAGGGTSDYQALSLAVQRMRRTKLGKDPEAKKIILNITDGNVGRNAESIQKLYTQNPDIRIISFGIDENEETARAIALSYGKRYGVAVSDISTMPRAVMRRLKLELKKPVPSDVARTIINNALIFGFSALSGAILMGTNGLIQFMEDIDFNKLPKEEPVYEGSKFLIVRENRKEFLIYRDPETEEEKIRIERGSRSNKRVPKIEWNPAFETEQNIEFLIKMFQRLEPREEDNLMRNLLLSGEAGTGKNVLIEYAAKLANQNLRLMSIHKRTDKNQLIKRRTFGEEKSPDGKYLRKTGWANSELVEAAINGDWIILDEINKAEADNLGVLNDMLAMGRFIDKDGKTRKVDRDFRIIAAANPPDGIYAVNALSGEFIDRMSRLELDYQSEENEIKLLQSWAPNVPKERIELLVQAAWNLRARYFGWTSRANMLAEDEVPAEKGTYIRRPISTAELRKIVEHFNKYPYDLENRSWGVINRHFSLANEDPLEVETMKEEIRSEFEGLGFQDKISIGDIVIQPENNQIEVKEDKATRVKTRFWKIKPDKGGDELNLKLIDEGPADKNEEPEKLIDEVPRNLVHFYDIAQDISLGNPLLFTGHAGTGKNVIADFVSYMLAGGAYLISINRLIEPGDLTAWRGFAELSEEEKTEWIESLIVKAMREGKPVIIDEVNKADPGVVAILNSLLQTNTLTLPSGEVVEAKPGFCLIATMNPPISGLYEGVEPLSGEFIRRFSIHEFDYLPFEQELGILKKTGKYKVNEKYIERLLMAAGKLREKYIQERAIARPPSMRSLKRTIAYIRDHGDRLPGGKKKRKDEQIFEIFEEDFPLDDRVQKKTVRAVFKESDIALLPAGRVGENTPDAIDELLDGQPLVLRGEIKIEPDTGDKATDDILKVLQLNYDAVGAGKKIEALAKPIEERISEWSETDFKKHIESALYFREIMKVTLIIRGMAHSKDNLRALEKLEQKMEKHLLAYHWPATFFVEDAGIDTVLLEVFPETQSPKVNEIFGLLQIFFADENYRKDLLKILRNEYIEAELKNIDKGRFDESIGKANLLSRMRETLDEIAKDVKTQDARALKELSKFIAEELRKSGWPAKNRKFDDENILWQKYLRVIQKSSGLKNKKEIENTQKKAEKIFEKAKDLEEARIDSLYSFDIFRERIFEFLWGVQTARAPNPIKHRLEQFDKEFLNDFMDDIVWENKVYDNDIILEFLWIKASLSEILTSLNQDNAYRPKECANIIKDYINRIDEQFKTYHWPAYQKLKPFMQEFPIIGGPVRIGLTQEPIVLQPVVSAEQIKLWQTELEGLEKTAGREVEYYSKKEAGEWVENNLTTDIANVKKLAVDIIQNMPKEINISRFTITTGQDQNQMFTYFWHKEQKEVEFGAERIFSGPVEKTEETKGTEAIVMGLARMITSSKKWDGEKELLEVFSKRKGEEINDIILNFWDSFNEWVKEKYIDSKSQKLTAKERAFFEKYFDCSAGGRKKDNAERSERIAELEEKIRQAEGQLAVGKQIESQPRILSQVKSVSVPSLKLRQTGKVAGGESLKRKAFRYAVADEEGNRFIATTDGIVWIKADNTSTIITGTEGIDWICVDIDRKGNLFAIKYSTIEHKREKLPYFHLYFIQKGGNNEYKTPHQIELPDKITEPSGVKISRDQRYIYIYLSDTYGHIFRANLKVEKDNITIEQEGIKEQKQRRLGSAQRDIVLVGDDVYASVYAGMQKYDFDEAKNEFIKIVNIDLLASYRIAAIGKIIYLIDISQAESMYRLDTAKEPLELELIEDIKDESGQLLVNEGGSLSFQPKGIFFRVDKDTQKLILGIGDNTNKCLREFELLDENDEPITIVQTGPADNIEVSAQLSHREEIFRVMGEMDDKVHSPQSIVHRQKTEETERYNEIKEYIENIIQKVKERDLVFEESFIEELTQLKSMTIGIDNEIKPGDIFLSKKENGVAIFIEELGPNRLYYVRLGGGEFNETRVGIKEYYVHLPKKMLDKLAEGRGQITEDREQKTEVSEEEILGMLEEWGLGEEVVGDRELKRELELSNNRKLILRKMGNSEELVEIFGSDGKGLGNRRLRGSEEFDESGIIRIIKDKEVYIECFNDDRNGDNLYWKVSTDNLSVVKVSREEAYGEGYDVRREIVRLAGKYLIKSTVHTLTGTGSPQSTEEKEELEEILEKIKGYITYGNEKMSRKELSNIKATAWRVSQLVEGQWEMPNLLRLLDTLKDVNKDLDDLKSYFAAFINTFIHNPKIVEIDIEQQKDFIGIVEKAVELNQGNIFISKQLIHAFREMFDVWKDKDIRKKIGNVLTNAIKPENDDALNMEILAVLDEIWLKYEGSRQVIWDKIKGVIDEEKYSQVSKVKAEKNIRKWTTLGDEFYREETEIPFLLPPLANIDELNALEKNALMELMAENAKLIRNIGSRELKQKMVWIAESYLDDDSLEVRLAAAEALVKLAGDDENKKDEFRNMIWKMWDKKKQNNQIAEFVPAYAWALWWLGWDRNEIAKQIYDMFGKIDRHSDTGDILGIVVALCEIDVYTKEDKQKRIYQLIKSERIDNEIINPIRPQILDYLAKQIDESFEQEFISIIDSIIEQLQKENISSNLKADFADFLKKIYEKVNKGENEEAKEIIRQKISSLSPEVRIAVLPDEALLPVYPDNSELLEDEKTGAEYVERVFGVLEEKVHSPQSIVHSFKEDWEKLKELIAANPVEAINFAGDIIKKWQNSLSLEEIRLLDKLIIGLIGEETKVEIEISSVNYGKACQAYFAALKKGDETEIFQTYQRLMAEIKAADSLEMVESLQRMYLYLMQELSVIPIPFAFGRTMGRMGDGRWETRGEGRGTKDERRKTEGIPEGEIDLEKTERDSEVKEYIENVILKRKGRDLKFEKSIIGELKRLEPMAGEIDDELKQGDILLFVGRDGIVTREDFAKLGVSLDVIWNSLIEQGFIIEKDGEWEVSGKFKGLKFPPMVLPTMEHGEYYDNAICAILKQSQEPKNPLVMIEKTKGDYDSIMVLGEEGLKEWESVQYRETYRVLSLDKLAIEVLMKEWGLDDVSGDVRREIVRLAGKYLIKSTVHSPQSTEEKEELEGILREIKGYTTYGNAKMSRKELSNIKAIAWRVSQLVEGQWEMPNLLRLLDALKDVNKDLDDLKSYFAAFINTFIRNPKIVEIDIEQQKDFIGIVGKAIELNQGNIFISKQLIYTLREMFDAWENEEVRKRIVNILTNAIKPENDEGLNMEILEALDEIWPEIGIGAQNRIIAESGYSQQLKIKAKKAYFQRLLFGSRSSPSPAAWSAPGKASFIDYVSRWKSDTLLNKLALIELVVENIDLIKSEGVYEQVEKAILELLDDDNLEVRLAAAEALVKLVGDDELKKEGFREKILEMWDKKKPNNQIAEFAPVYAWVLKRLGGDSEKIIGRMMAYSSQAGENQTIYTIVGNLCWIDSYPKETKHPYIVAEIKSTIMKEEIINPIRPQIFDYLAKQIDESFEEEFEGIIDSIIKELKEKDISSNLKADFANFLKKIYEKVNKGENEEAKKIIGQKISSLPPEIRIAVLPDEALLPVYPDNAELLENEKTGAEYVERVFGVLQEEVTSHQSPVTSYKEELLQLKGVVVDDVSPVNIAREITRRLEELKVETIDEIEKALKDKPSKKTGDPSTSLGTGGRREMGDVESLTKAKEKIQKTDFIQPLRAFKEGKRKFFRYSAEMDINRILSKGRREGFGMFILPIPLSLLDAETFQELGNRIKGFLSGAKERVVRLFRREREDVSREKIKLNQARLAGFGEEGKERAVIIHHELFRDNPIMGRIIMSIVKQLREAGVDNLKVVLALDDPRRAEDFYKRIKKAGKGIDLSGQFDFVVSAQEPAENVIREIKRKYSGVERIDVLGIPAWAEKYEKLPQMKDNIMVICELGDENSIAEGGLGAWQVFNEFLNDEDREKLFGRGAMTTGFFKYKSKRVDKKFQRHLKSYRKFAESN